MVLIYNAILIGLMIHKNYIGYSEDEKKTRKARKEGRLTIEEIELSKADDPDAMLKVQNEMKKAKLYDGYREGLI